MTKSVLIKRQQGLSLLEAVVATAIAALALVALSRAVGQGSYGAVRTQQQAWAAMVASSVLASITYADEAVATPEGRDGRWQWRLHVEPVDVMVEPVTPGLAAAMVTIGRLELQVWAQEDTASAADVTVIAYKPWRDKQR